MPSISGYASSFPGKRDDETIDHWRMRNRRRNARAVRRANRAGA